MDVINYLSYFFVVIIMFDFRKVPLPDYSRLEDGINSVTHFLGVPIVIITAVMSLIKLGDTATTIQKAAIIICAVSSAIMYGGSAFYHGLKPSDLKRFARVLDHSNIFLMISGTLTAFYLLGVIQTERKLAVGLTIFSWVVAVVGILLTCMDLHRFRKVQMAMYIMLGWTAIFGIVKLWNAGDNMRHFLLLVAIGGVLYTVGAIVYGIGKKVKYVHAVFHIFVLAATIVQFCGIYKYMI